MPVVRRRRDWTVLLADLYFDRQVRNRLEHRPCDLFVGVAGQCQMSFEAARRRGITVWLYCLNSHLDFMAREVERELNALADPSPVIHPRMLARFRRECALADRILLNSEVAKQTFIAAGVAPDRLSVLTPPVDTERFRPGGAVGDGRFRVLYVGSIDARKGVHTLIAAFRRAAIPDSELLLVGAATTRRTGQLVQTALAGGGVRQEFHDFARKDPRPVFGRASVLVLPSVEDGFGLVVLEAMACGLPVIVTAHCGAADLVEEGVNGFVVPPRDVDALAERLQWLERDPQRAALMGAAARCTAERCTQTAYNRQLAALFAPRPLEEQGACGS
jgi:glycosyltransferase involved in cell wall biosynthesis